MIREIYIKNFAIIDEVRLEFDCPGLNVLTGETGSGKSIILGALGCILGERAGQGLVRSGSKKCTVEALIQLPEGTPAAEFLSQNDLLDMDNTSLDDVIIRRDIYSDGKSRAFINGYSVTASFLKSLGDFLVDIHGQHQHQSLLRPEEQMNWLDKMAGTQSILKSYCEAFGTFTQLLNEQKKLTELERDRTQRIDYLKYQIEEIESANLSEGDELELEQERKRLANVERVREALAKALSSLSDEYGNELSLQAMLGQSLSALKPIEDCDADIAESLENLNNINENLGDAVSRLQNSMERCEEDPERLEVILERLDLLQRLKRKFGNTYADIMSSLDDMKSEMADLESAQHRSESLFDDIESAKTKLLSIADQLSRKRTSAARKLEKRIRAQLEELGMKGAFIEIHMSNPSRGQSMILENGDAITLTGNGAEFIEFFISTNPGEPPLALRKIASGGEISRIMLALKSLLAERDDIPSLIFDEIDVGLGGETAGVVGEKLKELSKSHQVICITHFAQVASYADSHFAIEKVADKNRVATKVEKLGTDNDLVEEIARLLDGNKASSISRKHARELLTECRNA